MSNEHDSHSLFTVELKGDSVEIKLPVPKELETITLSYSHIDLAIEYYLLARYAYLHEMNSAFMLNTFWAVEHLILSVLVFKHKTKNYLSKEFEFHAITKYWTEAKRIVDQDASVNMTKFDNYIGKVKGYFSERYPQAPIKSQVVHTGKMPAVKRGGEHKGAVKFEKASQLNIDEVDHFVNFMLHDVTVYRSDCSINLTMFLARTNNTDLYHEENKYSVVFPNRIYQGEALGRKV